MAGFYSEDTFGGIGVIQRLFVVFVVVMGLAIGLSVLALYHTGQFRTITPLFNGLCSTIHDVAGAEDILIHPSGEFAFISSDNRRSSAAGKPLAGAIYFYDLENPNAELVNLTPEAATDFHPLGISLFQDATGRETLMVVNRRSLTPDAGRTNQVQIFDWTGEKLVQRRTVEGAGIVGPNDLIAVGHDSFYVTNDHIFTGGFLGAVEAYLPLPMGTVSYFDGKGFTNAAEGFLYANGIAVSKDGSRVFVTATVGQTLSVFDRDKKTGVLSLLSEVNLGTGPDNITVDSDGDLWIAAHPQLLSFIGHARDKTKYTPSQILRLVPGIGGHLIPQDIMVDAGDLISGASVAAAIGNRVLIGAAYERKFLDCSL